MKITPIAFDSMGVRSQCSFVETDDVGVLIDPAASLGPVRFGNPPHAREWKMLKDGKENMKRANDNLVKIIRSCPLDALVIDHHLLRDIGWKKRIVPVFEAAKKKGIKVLTAAEYAGQETNQLEANRSRLWKEHPDEKAGISGALSATILRKEE